jgi:hypothetical protein
VSFNFWFVRLGLISLHQVGRGGETIATETFLQKLSEREVDNALILSGIHEWCHRNHVFGIVVVDLLQIPKFPLKGGLFGDEIIVKFC